MGTSTSPKPSAAGSPGSPTKARVPRHDGSRRRSHPWAAHMIDHGLDLAVIGNGRTAALIDPCSRIVWWCFPTFDSDPVFCRLLSGNEEKGFSDVVLDDMVDY